jgi:hypothetical protein
MVLQQTLNPSCIIPPRATTNKNSFKLLGRCSIDHIFYYRIQIAILFVALSSLLVLFTFHGVDEDKEQSVAYLRHNDMTLVLEPQVLVVPGPI